ncbi:hypothetical protein C4F50_15715 [Flavobacterium sp. KB82]|uniref:Uncharacterized protein n=1 Tax=Flavobacterium hungaricum TaxID=2082725 RepID=A0ABR9TLZ3_9FLAO|nr:hypothetical protein [Flavobacterium hungaricum]
MNFLLSYFGLLVTRLKQKNDLFVLLKIPLSKKIVFKRKNEKKKAQIKHGLRMRRAISPEGLTIGTGVSYAHAADCRR